MSRFAEAVTQMRVRGTRFQSSHVLWPKTMTALSPVLSNSPQTAYWITRNICSWQSTVNIHAECSPRDLRCPGCYAAFINVLKFSRRQNSINFSRVNSRVKWFVNSNGSDQLHLHHQGHEIWLQPTNQPTNHPPTDHPTYQPPNQMANWGVSPSGTAVSWKCPPNVAYQRIK